MNDHKDYYNILGVNKKASHDEIKKAFRRLSLETHPDKTGNNEDSTNKFKEISEAWEVLQDSTKRKQYDMGNMLNDTVGINPEDLFKELFGGGNPLAMVFFKVWVLILIMLKHIFFIWMVMVFRGCQI